MLEIFAEQSTNSEAWTEGPCTEVQKLGLRHVEGSQCKAHNPRLDCKDNPRKELKGKVTSKSLSKLRNL